MGMTERFEELREAAKPLQEFLQKYYDPHVKVEVEVGRVSVTQEIMAVVTEVLD